jgi:hypothetical protein
MLLEHLGVDGITEATNERSGTLDVGEEEGERLYAKRVQRAT